MADKILGGALPPLAPPLDPPLLSSVHSRQRLTWRGRVARVAVAEGVVAEGLRPWWLCLGGVHA